MIEPWFIPTNILMIICTALTIGLAMIFLAVIIFDQTCHSVPMMLVGNSCVAEFMFGSLMLSLASFTLYNDLKQSEQQDSLCIIRGFFSYIAVCQRYYSYLLQAIYRYIVVVYPTRLFYQSLKFQAFLMCCSWMFSFICPIPYLVTNEIQYNVNNQICQIPLRLSVLAIYNVLMIYIIPVCLIALIYFKLVKYVQEMSKHVTPANTLVRAQRELKMVRQLVILIVSITTGGLPYAAFAFISLFTTPPKYHFRIALIFVDVSLAFVMITLLHFTEPLKISLMKNLNRRPITTAPM